MSLALIAGLILASAPGAVAFLPSAMDSNLAPFEISQREGGGSEAGSAESVLPGPPLVQSAPEQPAAADGQLAVVAAPTAATPLAGFHFEYRRRTDWIFGGLGAFALWYAGSEYVTTGGPNPNPIVHVPIVGALYLSGWFMASALELGRAAANGSCGYLNALCGITAPFLVLAGIAMFVDGAAQAAGLGFSLAGLVTSKRVEVADGPTATVLPFAAPGGGGLSFTGHF